MKKTLLSISFLFLIFGASAQRNTLDKAHIPHTAVDTLPTDRAGVRIVTFADGTFRFVPADPAAFLSAPAYEAHWDTLSLFAYRDVALSDLPERIEITMAEEHGFRAPARGKILSKYGPRGRRAHNGVDIKLAHGEPVMAAFDGIVRYSRYNTGGFGNLVIVRHPSGLETYYAHLSRRAVVAGEWVRAGGVIGYGGRTGRATTEHLHFEARYSDQSFDPERIIDFAEGTLKHRDFTLRREYFNIRSRAVEGIEGEADSLASADSLARAGLIDSLTSAGVDSLAIERAAQTGATIVEEAPRRAAPQPVYHKIKSGDTLLALALHYNTTVAKICSLNGITRTTTLRIGRSLRIK
jgi:hypothetical protein